MFSSNSSQANKAFDNLIKRCNNFDELPEAVQLKQQEILQKLESLRPFIGKSRTGTLGNNGRPQQKLTEVNRLITAKYGVKLTPGSDANPVDTDKKFQSIAKALFSFRRNVSNEGDIIIEEIIDLCGEAIKIIQSSN